MHLRAYRHVHKWYIHSTSYLLFRRSARYVIADNPVEVAYVCPYIGRSKSASFIALCSRFNMLRRSLDGSVFSVAALHPEEGNYRRKGGLEQQHICDPDSDFVTAEAAASAAANANFSSSAQQQLLAQLAVQQPATLEMNLFSARENFDDLMTGVRKRGLLGLVLVRPHRYTHLRGHDRSSIS